MRFTDVELGPGDLRLRTLVTTDAALLVEATSGEPGRPLRGAHPAGPYSLRDAQVALAAWDPATADQFCLGIPERPGSTEPAYWVRPEERGRGIASRAVIAATLRNHNELAVPRVWLETNGSPSASATGSTNASHGTAANGHTRTPNAIPGTTASSGSAPATGMI